jgi:glycosyltransferase involved in cell wall biosynthesis
METNRLPPLKISVIIPNHNGATTLRRCLEAVRSSSYQEYECIMVDDSSTDNSIEIAKGLANQVVNVKGGPLGPAHARNLGAQAARGDIIFFVDADVVIYTDTLEKIVASFTGSPELAAVFGSYDDQPGDGHFLSQYKNLFHHFVHQQANENSSSFWSGCGAIKRGVFLESGGFDTLKYPHPSIEDIELGRRLTGKGYKILINKTLQVKHLKRWTLINLVKTDVFDRGIPWTQLVMEDRKIPNDLNLESSQRWSALFIGILLMFMTASALFHRHIILLPILLCLFWFMLQCWQWHEQLPQFEVGWPSFLKISIVFVLFVGLALQLGFLNYLPSVLILLMIIIAGPWLTRRSQFWRQAIFSLMMIAIGVVMLQVITTYPLWLTALVFLILGIFILFNRKFYAFFKQKRGMMFAIAVIPFHMLYFLYSMAAFALGTLLYYRKAGLPAEQGRGKS